MTILKTSGSEIVMGEVGQLCIIVSGRKPYSDATWDEYCKLCKELDVIGRNLRVVLNYSPIVGPSANQRRKFTSELAEENKHFKRVVLVSDSALVRGALTATTWLSNASLQMRAFSPKHTEEGFRWLAEVADFQLESARAQLQALVAVQGDDPMGLLR
jgi:hypothetical protein